MAIELSKSEQTTGNLIPEDLALKLQRPTQIHTASGFNLRHCSNLELAQDKDLCVISHPGWLRFYNGYDRFGTDLLQHSLSTEISDFIDRRCEELRELGASIIDVKDRSTILTIGLAHLPEILVSECRTESVIAHAIRTGMPTIVTLQCQYNSGDIHLLQNGERLQFGHYLATRIANRENIFVLPTEKDVGLVLGARKSFRKSDELDEITELCGGVFTHSWRSILLCGGYASDCLRDTTRYFQLPQIERPSRRAPLLRSCGKWQFVRAPLIEDKQLSIAKMKSIAKEFLDLSLVPFDSPEAEDSRAKVERLLRGFFYQEDPTVVLRD